MFKISIFIFKNLYPYSRLSFFIQDTIYEKIKITEPVSLYFSKFRVIGFKPSHTTHTNNTLPYRWRRRSVCFDFIAHA